MLFTHWLSLHVHLPITFGYAPQTSTEPQKEKAGSIGAYAFPYEVVMPLASSTFFVLPNLELSTLYCAKISLSNELSSKRRVIT